MVSLSAFCAIESIVKNTCRCIVIQQIRFRQNIRPKRLFGTSCRKQKKSSVTFEKKDLFSIFFLKNIFFCSLHQFSSDLITYSAVRTENLPEAICDISHRLGGITPFGVFSDAFPGLKMWVTFHALLQFFKPIL
jgi:hypothetical protein